MNDCDDKKKIDNEIIEDVRFNKNRINDIEDTIILNKKNLLDLDELEKMYVESNKKNNEVVDFLNITRSNGINRRINDYLDDDNSKLKKVLYDIDNKRMEINKEIDSLNNKKQEELDKIKNELNNKDEN